MKFLRSTIGCKPLDSRKNEEIRKELEVTALNDKITENRRNWNEHLNRMLEERLPVKAWKYKPKGKRDVGRPRKHWETEQVTENLILAVKKKKRTEKT
jgi:hypothetical protein